MGPRIYVNHLNFKEYKETIEKKQSPNFFQSLKINFVSSTGWGLRYIIFDKNKNLEAALIRKSIKAKVCYINILNMLFLLQRILLKLLSLLAVLNRAKR